MRKTVASIIDHNVKKFELLYFAGATPAEISKAFDITKTIVSCWMRRHGYEPINPEKQKIAMEMYKRGADDGAIAGKINMHIANVTYWREKNGLKKWPKRRKIRMC